MIHYFGNFKKLIHYFLDVDSMYIHIFTSICLEVLIFIFLNHLFLFKSANNNDITNCLNQIHIISKILIIFESLIENSTFKSPSKQKFVII